MQAYDIYKDITRRTKGDVYIGVVGPVRTGKSTFIKKFMDLLILPKIEDYSERERVIDEMPQSGAGRTIMTTQPNFVPNEAIEVSINKEANIKLRMVDCVGCMIEGALGTEDDIGTRMVRTPWFDYDIPFEQAAEVGTGKVIREHSTIGIVLTTDGSITGIPRENYVKAEQKVIGELDKIGKPYVIVLNTMNPNDPATIALGEELQNTYNAPVRIFDVMNITAEDINSMLEDILYEFPIRQVNFDMSTWALNLDKNHWLLKEIIERISSVMEDVSKVKDFKKYLEAFEGLDYIRNKAAKAINLGSGNIEIGIELAEELFYKILGEECGMEIKDNTHLLSIIKDFVVAKNEYDKLKDALASVKLTGYGIVPPMMDELSLEEPEMFEQGNRFGVKLKAHAPSLHMISVDVETEVSPLIGNEKQSEEFIDFMLSEFETDPAKIWNTDIFGKTMSDIVKEGLSNKLHNIPDDAREKLKQTMQRIVNEGDGGMLCILL